MSRGKDEGGGKSGERGWRGGGAGGGGGGRLRREGGGGTPGQKVERSRLINMALGRGWSGLAPVLGTVWGILLSNIYVVVTPRRRGKQKGYMERQRKSHTQEKNGLSKKGRPEMPKLRSKPLINVLRDSQR